MKRTVGLLLLALSVAAVAALPASATALAPGRMYGDVIDWGSDYYGTGAYATHRQNYTPQAGSLPTGRVVGFEQRTLFYLQALYIAPVSDSNYGDVPADLYNNGSNPEFTGLIYDMRVVDKEDGADVISGKVYPYRIYYLAGGLAFPDMYTGGRADLYSDSSTTHSVTAGPAGWVATAGQTGTFDPTVVRDTYATFSDGLMEASLTFLPQGLSPNGSTYVMAQKFYGPVPPGGHKQVNETEGFVYADLVYNGTGMPWAMINWNDGTTDASGNPMVSNVRFKAQYVLPGPFGWNAQSNDPLEFKPIPEPASMLLLGSSLLGLIPVIRRKK
jgi:hypothetical protein